jgi:hypothetical protein
LLMLRPPANMPQMIRGNDSKRIPYDRPFIAIPMP